MASSLASAAVVAVLERTRAAGAAEDEPGKRRVREREAQLGHKVYGTERAELYGTAPIAVAPEVGRLLYLLAAAPGVRRIVEIGASVGYSTIHLAAGLRDGDGDGGGGRLVSTELDARKARMAQENLAAAGLGERVDLRPGDAVQSLAGLGAPVDLLVLDGWNDLYLTVQELVEPWLALGAVVAADLSAGDPSCEAYATHMAAATGYVTVRLPLDEGVVLARRCV